MKMRHLHAVACWVLLMCCSALQAQTTWYNPLDGDVPNIQGRAWNKEIGRSFGRIPQRALPLLRQPVQYLSGNTAGLYIEFYTNAPSITVKYLCANPLTLPNLTTIAVSGVDMYTTDCHGSTFWCACPGAYRFGQQPSDTITFNYRNLAYNNIHQLGNKYRLFLPLYNSVSYLKIGVPSDKYFKFAPLSIERPIVVYGTSIAQGASASRPAMAWTNILQRRTDIPFINMGFSGSAYMESTMFGLLGEIDARAYIIDCIPNIFSLPDSILPRTVAGVRQLRKHSKAPILLVEGDGNADSLVSRSDYLRYTTANARLREAYRQLCSDGVEHLYYLTLDEIGMTPDAQIDAIHPNDEG